MLERPGYTSNDPWQFGLGWEAAHRCAEVMMDDYTIDGYLKDDDLRNMIQRMTITLQRRYEYV